MIKWEFKNWHKMYKDQHFRKLHEIYIDVLKAKEFLSKTSIIIQIKNYYEDFKNFNEYVDLVENGKDNGKKFPNELQEIIIYKIIERIKKDHDQMESI